MRDYLQALLVGDFAIGAELLNSFVDDTRQELAELETLASQSGSVRMNNVLYGTEGSSAQMESHGYALKYRQISPPFRFYFAATHRDWMPL